MYSYELSQVISKKKKKRLHHVFLWSLSDKQGGR